MVPNKGFSVVPEVDVAVVGVESVAGSWAAGSLAHDPRNATRTNATDRVRFSDRH
jgi:hypothetical protein